ncbi:hypothetical protein D917_00527 [Trichinella nativa]|uniref:Uncharacterized protein n=1 Tax=Trichinella nativa TaxID=6335 RepID=A0A1Y3E784_9BILA|nr:hypothetical protein D917_00527 [Trichinella nativa]
MKFWTLDGFDPNKILPQSVCYLLKEETAVACVHVKNPLQQPLQKVIFISKIHKVHHQMSIVHYGKDDIWALKYVVKLSKRYPGSRLAKALSLVAFGYAVTISSLTKVEVCLH